MRLLGCVGGYCICQTLHACASHELLSEQRTLDHLVYARGTHSRFVDAEWNVAGEPATPETSYPGVAVSRGHSNRVQVAIFVTALAVLMVLLAAGAAWLPATAPGGHSRDRRLTDALKFG